MPHSPTRAERPSIVRCFEAVSIIATAVSLVAVGVGWTTAIVAFLYLWNILSIARRGSSAARWVFTGLTVFGFSLGAYGLAAGLIRFQDITAISWVGQAASIVEMMLLWSPAMSDWIARRGPADIPPATT